MTAGAGTVDILYLAALREAVGVERHRCEAARLSDVFDWLRTNLEADAWRAVCAENVRIAINQELVNNADGQWALADGDEVAFLPPVTGG